MTASLHITPSRATSSNGLNLDGAKWYFYQSGTTTPKSVYTTSALSTAHSNPVVADAAGKFPNIFFDASLSYRGVLKTADDVTTIYDIDPINTDTFSQLAASGGSDLIGFLQAGTGAVARTAQDKMRDIVAAKDFGAFTTPAQRKAALLAALSAHDVVFVNAGVYDHIKVTGSNKTLIMDGGVEFKLPDNTVGSSAVTGPAVFHISGNNVTVEGNFTVNGNKANNSSNSFPTSVRIASCYVTGNNARFTGEVYVKNAYWVGFAAEDDSGSTTEITGLYVHRLKVEGADYHSVMLWSVTDWRVDEITATGGSVGSWIYGTKDQRIRLGTQLSNTSKCKNGSVGSIYSDRYITLTVENGANNVTVAQANTAGGGKIQNVSNVHFGIWDAYDASVKNQAYGLAIIDADNCSIASAIVRDYDCDNSFAGYAFAIDGATHCSIGSLAVIGSKATNANAWDFIVTTVDGLDIGSVILVSPTGTLGGFLYDYDANFAPQRDLTIGSMITRGHSVWDIVVESKTGIKIGSLNSDALEQYPNNRTNLAQVREGTWTPTISRSGSTVTYTSQSGRFVVNGNMVTAHFDITVDAVSAQGTGYWQITLPIAAKSSYSNQSGSLVFKAAAGTATGVYAPTGQSAAFLINSAGKDAFNDALAAGALSGSITYMIG